MGGLPVSPLQAQRTYTAGHTIEGIEIIGHLQSFGAASGKDIQSRFYSFLDGMTLDYVYELDGDSPPQMGRRAGFSGLLHGHV
jgi:hypothetical protein